MDKKIILTKLQKLFSIPELTNGFNSQQDAVSWANRVAPLLAFNQQYYLNFIQYSHKLNLRLSSYTITPVWNIMKSQVEMAIEELKLKIEIEEGIPEEMYFSENSQLDIQKNLAKIIRLAQKTLGVFDSYMDEKIIEELSEVVANEFKLLTFTPKSLFKQRLVAFKQQFPNKIIEARKSDKSHDRFYIIDNTQVWTLGASFNKAGEKATLLSRIKADKEKDKIINDFEKWWNLAVTL